jgi:hypothetical protein
MMNELMVRFSANDSNDATLIVKDAVEIALAAMDRDSRNAGMTGKFSMAGTDYDSKNEKVKKAILAFCGAGAGIKEITEKRHLVNAFNNTQFVDVYNAIVSETLLGVITRTSSAQLMALANIHEVEVGDSLTFPIETKGLPIAQRNSYNSNVILTDSYSTSAITVTPEVYSVGTSLDYLRILANGFDFGKEIARVALSLLYAQYKLVVGILFDTANLTGTPLYDATFDAATYTKIISYLQALNSANVKAYGTIPAFHAQGVTATTNYGFQMQDKMINDGFLGRAYGIENIAIDQATDLSAPFVDANLDSLLLVPNDKILLISDLGDKPVKLVRENFIRIMTKEPKVGGIYQIDYKYTMSFQAALVTQAHYGIVKVS